MEQYLVVALEGSKGILVMDGTGNVLTHIPLGKTPALLEADAPRKRLYVSSIQGIDVIDTAEWHPVGHVDIPGLVLGMAIDESQGVGYACDGTRAILHVFDLKSLEVKHQVSLSGPGFRPVVLSNGTKVYVGSGEEPDPRNLRLSGGFVDVVDPAEKKVIKTIPVPGITVHAMALDKERFLYVAANVDGHLVRINTTSDSLDPEFKVFVGRANDIALDSTRQIAYVSCEGADQELTIIDLLHKEEMKRFRAGQAFLSAVRDESGRIRRLFVPNVDRDLIVVLNTDDLFK